MADSYKITPAVGEETWTIQDLIDRWGISPSEVLAEVSRWDVPNMEFGGRYKFDVHRVKAWEIEKQFVHTRYHPGEVDYVYLPEYESFTQYITEEYKKAAKARDEYRISQLRMEAGRYHYDLDGLIKSRRTLRWFLTGIALASLLGTLVAVTLHLTW